MTDLWEGLPEVGEVRRLTLGPRDKVAVLYPERLSEQQAQRLRERLAVVWPDVPVAIFSEGIELAVISPGESTAATQNRQETQ